MKDENILNWTVESNFGCSPGKMLGRLGDSRLRRVDRETMVSASIRCPSCKSEAIEISATVNGEAKVLVMSGVPCPRCKATITVQWDARLTFDEAGNGACGGAMITP